MGACYETLIVRCQDRRRLVDRIVTYLGRRGFRLDWEGDLASFEGQDNGVLLSPVSNGSIEIVWSICNDVFGLQDGNYQENEFAAFLSNSHAPCIHFWSMMHGGCPVGYALYERGSKLECECVFSKYATDRTELCPGKVTPVDQPGPRLGAFIARDGYSFATAMMHGNNGESNLRQLLSDIGFDPGLIDYDDATEAIEYSSDELSGWIALEFSPSNSE